MTGNRIINLEDPVNAQDACIKEYGENHFLQKKGDLMEGDLDMAGYVISNVPTPTQDRDVANRKWVESHVVTNAYTRGESDARYLQLTGGTLTGNLNLGLHEIKGLEAPIDDDEPAQKK